jgi:REP element-mobilizing transposase RayT
MTEYPARLAHAVPSWVNRGSVYHIRIRAERNSAIPLTDENLGRTLLDSAKFYHESGHWHCHLLLLMPDHLHALLAYPINTDMGDVVGAWKGFHSRQHSVSWQGNYFDHRIRSKNELAEKAAYIRLNPVVKGLCAQPEEWPWVYCGRF